MGLGNREKHSLPLLVFWAEYLPGYTLLLRYILTSSHTLLVCGKTSQGQIFNDGLFCYSFCDVRVRFKGGMWGHVGFRKGI